MVTPRLPAWEMHSIRISVTATPSFPSGCGLGVLGNNDLGFAAYLFEELRKQLRFTRCNKTSGNYGHVGLVLPGDVDRPRLGMSHQKLSLRRRTQVFRKRDQRRRVVVYNLGRFYRDWARHAFRGRRIAPCVGLDRG